ncbi:Oligosaccharide repeat unit polymerase Wzy [Streptococcus oralis subsp. dentisani]|nr:Oligosaccharide repeat unit polymerase Wzy [Streptococcus oralis subsp. dentisani]
MSVRKLSLIDILDYMWIILIIVQCHSIYTVKSEPFNLTVLLLVTTAMLLLLNLLRFTLSIKFIHKFIYMLGLYFIAIVTFFLTNIGANLTILNITKYFIMLPLFFLINSIYMNKKILPALLSKFVNVVVILAIFSLFFWIFGTLLNVVHPTSTVINQWSGGRLINSYYNLYFETQQMIFFGIHIIRNSGIFAESPIWGLILSIAYVTDLLILKSDKNNKRNIIILTMLSTISTTGIIIIGLAILYKITTNRHKAKLLLFPVTLGLGFSLLLLLSEKSETVSANLRVDDYNIGFKVWKASFWIGHGLNNGILAIQSHIPTFERSLGYSNTLFVILAQGGLLLFLIYFSPMILILFKKNINLDFKFAIILFFILVTTIIFEGTFLFFWILTLSYSYYSFVTLDKTGT